MYFDPPTHYLLNQHLSKPYSLHIFVRLLDFIWSPQSCPNLQSLEVSHDGVYSPTLYRGHIQICMLRVSLRYCNYYITITFTWVGITYWYLQICIRSLRYSSYDNIFEDPLVAPSKSVIKQAKCFFSIEITLCIYSPFQSLQVNTWKEYWGQYNHVKSIDIKEHDIHVTPAY